MTNQKFVICKHNDPKRFLFWDPTKRFAVTDVPSKDEASKFDTYDEASNHRAAQTGDPLGHDIQTVEVRIERVTAEQIAADLSRFVNGSLRQESDELVELILRDHRTLQQGVFGLVVKLIQAWAAKLNPPGGGLHFDQRNEYTVRKCDEIVSHVDLHAPPLI